MPKHLLITEPTLDNLTEFLAQHRALFGDAVMVDGDDDGGEGGDDGDGGGGEKPPAEPPALVEERNARKAAETILSELLPGKSKAEIRKALKAGGTALESLRPQKPAPKKDADGGGDQPDAEQMRRDAETAANERANVRIVSAEVRAIAAELFEDPADAPLYLDLTDYDVDDDGNVDAKKIRADLKALLERKKHLAKKGTKPKPDKSQGPKTDPGGEAGTGRRRLAGAYASSSAGK